MNTASPRRHDGWLPAQLKSLAWDVQAHYQAVRARMADLDALVEAITDPRVDRRVVIDQAVDLRRTLLDQAEQAPQPAGSPASAQPRLRRGARHEQVTLGALEALPQANTTDAALVASAGALRPLAGALVDQPDLDDVAQRSVTTCRRFLLIADHVITTGTHFFSRR